jgi:two-component system, NtrC family, sensor kinase
MGVEESFERREPFDREYGLADLLPVEVLNDLGKAVEKLTNGSFMVLHLDGRPYYTSGKPEKDEILMWQRIVQQERIDTPKSIRAPAGLMVIFPLIHELEPLGFLGLGRGGEKSPASPSLPQVGLLLLTCLGHLIRYKYKSALVAGLHDQVVNDSYAELKEKAELLERSERKYRHLAENLEKEVQRKTKEIEQTQIHLIQNDKMASIGQLAAGVAHEINNPIGFVKSNLGTLNEYSGDLMRVLRLYEDLEKELRERQGEMKPLLHNSLEFIAQVKKEIDLPFIEEDHERVIKDSLEGAERVAKIVADLKDFAHLDRMEMGYAHINQGIDSTLNIIWSELKDKAEVIKDFGNIPPINCYPQKLNQVFLNILMNAAQAIDGKGKITITTRLLNREVEIRISDTGCGIPEETLPRIFDPFFTTKEVGKGTGLGLHVAYSVVQKHNGRIEVQSEVGKGTTFILRLPADGAQELRETGEGGNEGLK